MKDFSSVLVISAFMAVCLAQRTPTISYITRPDIKTRIGGTIEMDCSVLYATEYPVLWVKLPQNCLTERTSDIRSSVSDQCTPIPLSSGSALIVRDNRFSMRYDTASSTFTLQIKDVQRTDEATYQCQIIVGINNKVTKHVKIVVSQPPVITDNSTRSVVVQENVPAELMCHAHGSPTPAISWRRENNAILPTGGIQYKGNVLKIHSVKKEDRGTYYCVADNHVGKPARRNVAVEVEFPPTVDMDGLDIIPQVFGYSVELVCQVEAYPPATITWVHDGVQLSSNVDYAVDNGFSTVDDITITSVRIKSLSPRTLGKYYCRAQNKLGPAERVAEVVQSSEVNCAMGGCNQFANHASNTQVSLISVIATAILTVLKVIL